MDAAGAHIQRRFERLKCLSRKYGYQRALKKTRNHYVIGSSTVQHVIDEKGIQPEDYNLDEAGFATRLISTQVVTRAEYLRLATYSTARKLLMSHCYWSKLRSQQYQRIRFYLRFGWDKVNFGIWIVSPDYKSGRSNYIGVYSRW